MVSANLVLSLCICSLACVMMFCPEIIADSVAAIRDISQNSARYRTLYAQMANLEKRLAAAEAAVANCSKHALNGRPDADNLLADVAADIETLLRRQNEYVASVSKQLKIHDENIQQVNNTVVLLWKDITVLRGVVNDASDDFNTTKRLIEAFEKNAARFVAASTAGEKNSQGNRGAPTFGPDEPAAFDQVSDENYENEESDDENSLSFGMGGSLNPDGSTPVIARPKDAPKVVFELHEEGFEKAMQEGHQLVIMFYAPWCPHCKSALGPFEVAGGQSQVGFARINGDDFPEVGSFCCPCCSYLT
jgi:thiol-disulfide isomerase/thioredoxin